MVYVIDIDNTICKTFINEYTTASPLKDRIDFINKLFDAGHIIKLFTARCMSKHNGDIHKVYNDIFTLTKSQLDRWGVKYHELILGKPSGDLFIDDQAVLADTFFACQNTSIKNWKTGIIIGCFDVIHPGYIKLFEEAKANCAHLTIALHNDPSADRPSKLKPILSVKERIEILKAIKYIDNVVVYITEEDLCKLLAQKHYDIRFVGSDYLHKNFPGQELCEVYYVNRDHGWSSTKFKEMIYEQIKSKKEQ